MHQRRRRREWRQLAHQIARHVVDADFDRGGASCHRCPPALGPPARNRSGAVTLAAGFQVIAAVKAADALEARSKAAKLRLLRPLFRNTAKLSRVAAPTLCSSGGLDPPLRTTRAIVLSTMTRTFTSALFVVVGGGGSKARLWGSVRSTFVHAIDRIGKRQRVERDESQSVAPLRRRPGSRRRCRSVRHCRAGRVPAAALPATACRAPRQKAAAGLERPLRSNTRPVMESACCTAIGSDSRDAAGRW